MRSSSQYRIVKQCQMGSWSNTLHVIQIKLTQEQNEFRKEKTMKGLKKIALVAAIAAAPLASHAGMKALDDTTMGNVTGQAGVTIELETRVSIGEFTYTDEGSFVVSDIEIGGANASGLLDDPGNPGQFIAVPGMATQSDLLDDL